MYFLKTSPAIDYKNHRTSKDKAWEDGTGEMRCVFPSKGNTRFRGGNGRAFGETVNRLVSFDRSRCFWTSAEPGGQNDASLHITNEFVAGRLRLSSPLPASPQSLSSQPGDH